MKVLREVSDGFAMWTYLSHEDRYKGTLADVRGKLALDGPPRDLPAQDILTAIQAAAFDDADYGKAVVLTCHVLSKRRWTEREYTSGELGSVGTMLSDAGLPGRGAFVPGRMGAASTLLAGWKDFLHLPQVAKEAEGHSTIVKKLQGGEFVGHIMLREEDSTGHVLIADGRHRLFAVLDVAAATGERSALVLYGERRT